MKPRSILLALIGAITLGSGVGPAPRAQSPVRSGFRDTVVLTGLESPTAVRFSPDGRVFVAEKSGIIKLFSSLSDTDPTVFADLRTQVYNYWDRGLLGLELDPGFPTKPYVYVLYTRDAQIGGVAPRWGSANASDDPCPDPPGGTTHGCVASGRLSRLRASGDAWDGVEHVLVDDWFQQFPSHSIGSLAFGPDGALYASGGEAASWTFVDYGQAGQPRNPAGDPPVPIGGTQTPPTAEGGSLRAQDLRTGGDPVGLSGTVIRVNPDTGAALPDNPLYSSADPNARRIVAYGLRNPFRIAARPGTREVWVGDVGANQYEEIDIIPDPAAARVPNFGWPCYEGTLREPGFDAANLNVCEDLYADTGAVTFAHYQYQEQNAVVPGEACGSTDSSLSGLAFYEGGTYPPEYRGALFFADYTRGCIWVMPPGTGGVPDPSRRATFIANAAFPVDLQTGPGGDIFYVDVVNGAIRRIQYDEATPEAQMTAAPTSGPLPLTVQFDASGSRDPGGSPLAYSWDLNGDGTFGDSRIVNPSYTYTAQGTYVVRVRVTDDTGLTDEASMSITAGNTAPDPVIDSPAATLRWRVGQSVTFSGHATDAEDGSLPAAALRWALVMNHCSTPASCHEHVVQEYRQVSGGTFVAPDHEHPSYLTLRLTATDAAGLTQTATRRLDPQTVAVTFDTSPSGLQLVVASSTLRAPATQTFIVGSAVTITAPSPQTSGSIYRFSSWSDAGAQTHTVTIGGAATTYRATFTAASAGLPSGWSTRDIGAVGAAGSASYANGVFSVSGAGADVWGSVDAFRYVYRSMTGDGAIVARVASIQGSQPWTKMGVMIRASTDPGAAHAFMVVSLGKGLAFQRRTGNGALTTHTSGGAGTAPRWVRLTRVRQVVAASVSTDGGSWTTVGSDTVNLPATALVGLVAHSHDTRALASAAFDNVALAPPDGTPGPLPSGWSAGDIGPVGVAGSASHANGVFTLRGAGADIWGSADAFHYAYQSLTGDGTIIARVATIQGRHAWTKMGVMVRATADPGSAHAFMLVSTGKGLAFQRRTTTGGLSTHTSGGTGTAPRWVKLARTGQVIRASVSTNGVTWTLVGEDTLTMPATALWGLAGTSHDATTTASATFDNVSVTATSMLPAGWSSRDIGSVGVAGRASHANGVFTVRGAGADVWGTVDAFHYVYRSMTGDGTLTSRVPSLQGTHAWTKVGVMMRATTDADSAHAFMLVSKAKGLAFQRRTATGGLSTHSSGGTGTAPRWVRLVRTGQVITASVSTDGVSWTVVGSDTFNMPGTVLAGLAVTSHDATTLATGTFDNGS